MPGTQKEYLDAYMAKVQEECSLPLTFEVKNIMTWAFNVDFAKGRDLGSYEGAASKERRILDALGAAPAIPEWDE